MSSSAVFERQALCLTNHYVSLFNLDRSLSRSRLAEADALKDEFCHISERWHLAFLVVDPTYQRLGIGGCLVDWGIEKARKEKIPATTLGSQAGQSMYRKRGLKDYRLSWLREGVDAMAMIYIPEGTTVTEIDTQALEFNDCESRQHGKTTRAIFSYILVLLYMMDSVLLLHSQVFKTGKKKG